MATSNTPAPDEAVSLGRQLADDPGLLESRSVYLGRVAQMLLGRWEATHDEHSRQPAVDDPQLFDAAQTAAEALRTAPQNSSLMRVETVLNASHVLCRVAAADPTDQSLARAEDAIRLLGALGAPEGSAAATMLAGALTEARVALAVAHVGRNLDPPSPVQVGRAGAAIEDAWNALPEADPRRARWLALIAGAVIGHLPFEVAAGSLDLAIEVLTARRRQCPPDSDSDHEAAASLVFALVRRFEARGSMADLDAAVDLARSIPGSKSSEAVAMALRERFERRVVADPDAARADIDDAISCRRQLLDDEPAEFLSVALTNLSDALAARYIHYRDPNDALDAAEHARNALAHSDENWPHRHAAFDNAAKAMQALARLKVDPKLMAEALSFADQAVHLGSPDEPYSATHLARRASVLLGWFASRLPGAPDAPTVTVAIRDAIDALARLNPSQAPALAATWARWAHGREAWDEVAEAAERALAVRDRLVSGEDTWAHRETWLHALTGVAALGADALVRIGEPKRAAAVVEAGRTVLLTARLGERNESPPLASTTADAIVCYLVPTPSRTLLLWGHVGPNGMDTVRWSDAAGGTSDQITRQARELLDADLRRTVDRDAWLKALWQLCGWLGDTFASRLLEVAASGPDGRLVLVPLGMLSVLPLHAARWTDRDGHHYVVDHVSITYAPSARFYRLAVDSAAACGGPVEDVVVVEEPLPSRGRPLGAAGTEVRAVTRRFPNATVLPGAQASPDVVRAAMRSSSAVHLICHGRADIHDPLSSRVLLAGGDDLTVGDLLDEELHGLRLAVLAACQTSVIGRVMPDEFVGLPAGLVAAGAAAVIGSLWSVPDVATAALMELFYERWEPGTSPAGALAQAQRQFRSHYPVLAHPANWAAFCLVGA